MSNEPDLETRRRILTQKRDQYRAKGYDHAVTARIAAKLGRAAQAEQSLTTSQKIYEAAAETQAILDELEDEADE